MAVEDSIKAKVQHANIYNNLLPYNESQEEIQAIFIEIKDNLIKSVLSSEIRPGCTAWSTRLTRFIALYGYNFSIEDHILLVKLYYEIINIPNLDSIRLSKFANTLSLLLKKKHLLSPDDLILPWRPLNDLLVKATKDSVYRHCQMDGTLNNLVRHCRFYFPDNVTEEMLVEFWPTVSPYTTDMNCTLECLSSFLPIIPKRDNSKPGYMMWIGKVMELWENCNNASSWENSLCSLIASLAQHNIGHIDWDPYVPAMYARFMRSLHMPVVFRNRKSSKTHKIEMRLMASWIVSTLGVSDKCFTHLENLMHTLKSYYHSANTGRWSVKVRELLRLLSVKFVERVNSERYRKPSWNQRTTDCYKLTDEHIDRFVLLMRPCAETAIFTNSVSDIRIALYHLAALRPNLVIPMVLDKLYGSMDSLTEPHRLTSSITCLSILARFLARGAKGNYPDGPTHVIPLLFALLPGIDPNDFSKSVSSLNLICALLSVAPACDSSAASQYYTDMTESEHSVCEATAQYEDFVIQFVDRLCVFVESRAVEFVRLEQTNDFDLKSHSDSLTESAVSVAVNTIFYQCSPRIYTVALKKFFNFITNRVLEAKVSGALLGIVGRAFVHAKPEEASHILISYYCDLVEGILDEVDTKTDDDISQELHYNLVIFAHILDGVNYTIPYLDRLTRVMKSLLKMKNVQGMKSGAQMLSSIIRTLSTVKPLECTSTNFPLTDDVQEHLMTRYWGDAVDIKHMNVKWFVPGENEIHHIEKLIVEFLVPELECLDRYASDDIKLERQDLEKSLRVVYSILSAQSVLPFWDLPVIDLWETSTELRNSMIYRTGYEHFAKMSDGRNVRQVIAETVHRVQKKLLDIDESDTKNILLIIQIVEDLLQIKYKQWFNMRHRYYNAHKKALQNCGPKKERHMRSSLIERTLLQHEMRVAYQCSGLTEIHKQLFLDLFELSTCCYSMVRSTAQQKLQNALNLYSSSYKLILPKIEELLQQDHTDNDHRLKGCLYILLTPKARPLILIHDWKTLSTLWPLLIKSQPSEKLSIVNLMAAIQDNIQKCLSVFSLKVEVTDSTMVAARNFGRFKNVVDVNQMIQSGRLKNEIVGERNRKHLNDMTRELLRVAESGNLHWRYHELALLMIRALGHPELHFTPQVINYTLKSLLNESLSVRKIALSTCRIALSQMKPKFKKFEFDLSLLSTPLYLESDNDIKKINNQWLMYNSATVPRTEEEWNDVRFMQDRCTGFYAWPRKPKMYCPPNDQPTANKTDDAYSEREREFINFFNNADNITQLIKHLTFEERKGKDAFNPYRWDIFRNIFKIFEDKFLSVIIQHLTELVADKDEHKQRCASEIISGLISGAKHWSYTKTENMWKQLIPLLRTAFSNISIETEQDWSIAVGAALEFRDPNRYHWFLEFLVNDPLHESTTFLASMRMLMAEVGICQQQWRNKELIDRCVAYLRPHCTNSFQNVRNRIAKFLVMAYAPLTLRRTEPTPELDAFFNWTLTEMGRLEDECMREGAGTVIANKGHNTPNGDSATDMFGNLEIAESDADHLLRMFKILGKFVVGSVTNTNHSPTPNHYRLLRLCCILQSNDTDEELQVIATNYLALIGHNVVLECHMQEVLDIITQVTICRMWSARTVIAEFLSVFIFHNMPLLQTNSTWVQATIELVLKLLGDPQPEVRTQAANVLSGLYHCSFIPEPLTLLETFKQKASALNRGKSKTLNGGWLAGRHAAVLGCCAFVKAHPYDVPDFLPDVFLTLSGNLNDPQPIPATIRKVMGDFKRTHHDDWDLHKLKFTADELSLLSDITVPPSYYV